MVPCTRLLANWPGVDCKSIGMPNFGAKVIRPLRSIKESAITVKLKRCKIVATTIFVSITAKAAPIHVRDPSPNGMYSYGEGSQDDQRSGINFSGSGNSSGK